MAHLTVLSTGNVVAERPLENGATEAYLLGGDNMTEREWEEYCGKLRSRLLKDGFTEKRL
jgi:hypothetical protein